MTAGSMPVITRHHHITLCVGSAQEDMLIDETYEEMGKSVQVPPVFFSQVDGTDRVRGGGLVRIVQL